MPEALLQQAETARVRGEPQQALRLYARIPQDGGGAAVRALLASGEILTDLGRLSDAEEKFRAALAAQPHNATAHERLADLLFLVGRRWEARPHLLEIVRRDDFSIDHLLRLGHSNAANAREAELHRWHATAPHDPLPRLGLACADFTRGDWAAARRTLEELVQMDPERIEARVRLGRILFESGAQAEFFDWLQDLPDDVNAHPGAWILRAQAALQTGKRDAAARCFWEALRRDPDHRRANYWLGQWLAADRNAALAERFLRRADVLDELEAAFRILARNHDHVQSQHRVVELTASLGRLWEARAWCLWILERPSAADWARERLTRLEEELPSNAPQTIDSANPALALDLSDQPLLDWESIEQSPLPASPPSRSAGNIRFSDVAAAVGLDFTYFNSPDPATEGKRMFEFTGGGVAVLDFDGDGWPDLYFPQGCRWPPDDHPGEFRDRLFRNVFGESAIDVTEACGLGDDGFSQGAAVGDFNQDGFPDLYVANIGENRLYCNNGDGTFRDVAVAGGLGGNRWTTSCAIADLNGDGHPDLYDVNYLTGDNVFEMICSSSGIPRVCVPLYFPAEQDQVFLSNGAGGFRDVTESAGIVVPDGKGLGLVVAQLDGRGGLDLFVANDGVANFYFVNQADPGDNLRFAEQGLLSGLAFDENGKAQACMGVAAGDANGDRRLDFFVTNFHHESNTLYVQQPGGTFIDATRHAGLVEPSFDLLGFGTQFLDADLDGWPDLVAVNGHIDDFRHEGAPYRMRPQVFHNLGEGRFVELADDSVGPWFQGEYLGRGLARLDWNRDGREEFAVSHLDTPAALLVNETASAGHSLAIRLIGTSGDRDAIGTTVRVTAGGRTWTRQLTAGDGYMASNERRLVFGLGEATGVDAIEVQWTSGTTQTFRGLPVDSEWTMIEGRARPVRRVGNLMGSDKRTR